MVPDSAPGRASLGGRGRGTCRPTSRARPCRARSAARPAPRSRPPAGCCSRSTATPPSTGSPRWPPGSLGAGHAKVTLFTDQDTVVGGFGLPPGVIGGPALLTGALSAIVVPQRRPAQRPRRGARTSGSPTCRRSRRARSGPTSASPLVAASGHVVGGAGRLRPRAAELDRRRGRAAPAAGRLRRRRAGALRRPVGGRHLGRPAERRAGGQLDRHLGARPADRRQSTGTSAARRSSALDGAIQFESDAAMESRFVHPDDVGPPAGGHAARRSRSTASSRPSSAALTVDGTVRWMVARGRLVTRLPRRAGAAAGHDPRRHRRPAAGRRSGCRPCSGRRRSPRWPPSWPTPPGCEDLPEIVQRGAQVLGAQSSALAVFDPDGGPLRLHMTNRLTDEVQGHVDYPVAGVEIELDDDAADPVRRDARPSGCCWPTREEVLARFPADAGGHRGAGRPRGRRPAAARGGADPRLVRRALGDRAPVRRRRRRGARGAGRPDRAERLAAAGRRRARRRPSPRWPRRTSGCSCSPRRAGCCPGRWRSTSRSASWPSSSSRSWATGAGSSSPTSRAGCTSWRRAHRDPSRREEVEAYVRSMVAVDDRRGRRRGSSPAPGGRWSCRRSTGSGSSGRCPIPRRGRRWPGWASASGAVVPLVARGQTLGALGLFNREERGPLSPGRGRHRGRDRPPGRPGAAPRAALRPAAGPRRRAAAQHAHRAAASRTTAQIVVRYVPAAAGAEIGGDWYDAFLQPDGATVLAIGDVVGHDTRAAAAMGQVRGLLRGIGYSSGGSPAEVLTELDRAIEGLALDTMATALVARLEQDDDDLRAGRVRLRWSSAGHPPPAVLDRRRQGRAPRRRAARPAARRRARAPRATEHVAVLDAGRDRAALHRRPGRAARPRPRRRHRRAGRRCSRECADLPLDELCDQVLKRLFLPDAEDDVAMLAVRLHPQDEPRPRRPARRWSRRASSRRPTCSPRPAPRLSSVAAVAGAGPAGCGCAAAGRRRPAPPSRARPTAPAAPRPAR